MRVRRPDLVLAGAVVICLPMVPGVLNGNITTVSAGLRLALAIVICWTAGSLLTSIVDRYSREVRRAQALKLLAAARRAPPGTETTVPPAGGVTVEGQR